MSRSADPLAGASVTLADGSTVALEVCAGIGETSDAEAAQQFDSLTTLRRLEPDEPDPAMSHPET